MKIQLTCVEAFEAIRKFYNFPASAEIEIVSLPQNFDLFASVPVFVGESGDSIRQSYLNVANNVRFNKITAIRDTAIRELRSLTGMGLKESKDAVENWEVYATIAHRTNRWPRVKGLFDGRTTFE